MPPKKTMAAHFTSRRSFVATAGFGGVSLYGLWAAYGAAPGPLTLLGLDGAHGDVAESHGDAGEHGAVASSEGGEGGAHGGHGAAPAGTGPEAFRRMTDEFIERYRLPDGTVHPRRLSALAQPGHDAHAAHPTLADNVATPDGPIDIPMVAGKWYYLPAALRLDAGEAYRLRMMAVDVSHGASIQFGTGGRMARLRPGRVAEVELSFHRPGRYFMYCTVYCGAAHDFMQATIEVV